MLYKHNGIIIVDKPEGFTSHDVVAKLRGVLKLKKIGHAGTLDPMATGVLPVCLGYATKAADYIMDGDKCYEAEILFGITTDTQDINGEILKRSDSIPTYNEVESALKSFEGEILQVPPMFSAIKIGGQKLYKLARKGLEIERAPRRIVVYKTELMGYEPGRAKIRVSCSKGTYIRTLCNDLGNKLSCGGCMSALMRVKNGPFEIKDAVGLEDITPETVENLLISPETLFLDLPRILVHGKNLAMLQNGVLLNQRNLPEVKLRHGQRYSIYSPDGFAALCEGEEHEGEVRLRIKFKVV